MTFATESMRQASFRNEIHFVGNTTSSNKSGSVREKGYIYLHSLLSCYNLAHFIVLIGAVLCFLPNMMGYSILIDLYPDNLESLSGLSYNNSIVASVAVTISLLLENILDFIITYRYFGTESNDGTSSKQTEITYFKFPVEILLLILAKDFVLITFIIPNNDYNIIVGFTLAVDIIFQWCYLYNLCRLGSSVWTLPKVFGIMLLFMAADIAFVWLGMSDAAASNKSLLLFIQIIIGVAIFSLWCLTVQWFRYVWRLDLETVDLAEYLKAVQASVFVVFFNVYVLADWVSGFLGNDLPPEWNTVGVSFLVMMTYFMSVGTLCVSLITGRVSKFGALAFSKVSAVICFLFSVIWHSFY